MDLWSLMTTPDDQVELSMTAISTTMYIGEHDAHSHDTITTHVK